MTILSELILTLNGNFSEKKWVQGVINESAPSRRSATMVGSFPFHWEPLIMPCGDGWTFSKSCH